LAIHKRQGSQGILIASSLWKFRLNILVWSILTELIDKMLWTGITGLSNCKTSPRHLESLPHVRICFGLYFMECDIKPCPTTFTQCITKQLGVTITQHPE
jgi:hypothetical protein